LYKVCRRNFIILKQEYPSSGRMIIAIMDNQDGKAENVIDEGSGCL
jgi:hypothetical protein